MKRNHKRQNLRVATSIYFLLLAFLVLQQISHSQIPSRPLLYSQCTVEYFPTPEFAPPYSTDMPLEVYQTYFVLDSLCKMDVQANTFQETMALIKSTLSPNQLDSLLKYIHITLAYDPVRFYAYKNLGAYINSSYLRRPSEIFDALKWYANEIHKQEEEEKYFYAFACGIYDVEIINTTRDSSLNGTMMVGTTCFEARILDVIKGQSMTRLNDAGSRIVRFSYSDYEIAQNTSGSPYVNYITYREDTLTGDPIAIDGYYSAIHNPQIGDRYLVFLNPNMEYHTDSLGVPYFLRFFSKEQYEGGMFKVANNILHDEENYFGLGNEVNVDMVKAHIRNYIKKHILR